MVDLIRMHACVRVYVRAFVMAVSLLQYLSFTSVAITMSARYYVSSKSPILWFNVSDRFHVVSSIFCLCSDM